MERRPNQSLSVGGLKHHNHNAIIGSSATLFIALHGVQWRIFSKSTVTHTKMGHMSKTTPLLGVICHPFGKT